MGAAAQSSTPAAAPTDRWRRSYGSPRGTSTARSAATGATTSRASSPCCARSTRTSSRCRKWPARRSRRASCGRARRARAARRRRPHAHAPQCGLRQRACCRDIPVARSASIDLTVAHHEPRNAIDARHRVRRHGDAPRRRDAPRPAPGERREQVQRLLAALEPGPLGACVVMGDLNEWYLWGRPLRWLHAQVRGIRTPATFPARRPVLKLDRIWAHPPSALHVAAGAWQRARARRLRSPAAGGDLCACDRQRRRNAGQRGRRRRNRRLEDALHVRQRRARVGRRASTRRNPTAPTTSARAGTRRAP